MPANSFGASNFHDIADAPEHVALSGTSALSAVLKPGYYSILSTADVYLKRGTTGATATVASNFPLKANVYWPMQVKVLDAAARDQVAAILASGTGTLYITKHG